MFIPFLLLKRGSVGGGGVGWGGAWEGRGSSLVIQWLGLCISTAEGMGSIPLQGTKIPLVTWCGQKKKNERKKSGSVAKINSTQDTSIESQLCAKQ